MKWWSFWSLWVGYFRSKDFQMRWHQAVGTKRQFDFRHLRTVTATWRLGFCHGLLRVPQIHWLIITITILKGLLYNHIQPMSSKFAVVYSGVLLHWLIYKYWGTAEPHEKEVSPCSNTHGKTAMISHENFPLLMDLPWIYFPFFARYYHILTTDLPWFTKTSSCFFTTDLPWSIS